MSQTRLSDRARLARLIIILHGVLIVFVAFLHLAQALLPTETTALLALLAPLTSLYAGTFFRNLTTEIRADPAAPPLPDFAQAGVVRGLILAHFGAMLFLIAAKAMFNWIGFSNMILMMGLVETAFGSYMGAVLSAVFDKKE